MSLDSIFLMRYTYLAGVRPSAAIPPSGGFAFSYMLYTQNKPQETAEFIELLERNPFTPVEELFIDFYGKDRAKNLSIKAVLDSLDEEKRAELILILNTAGFDDVI